MSFIITQLLKLLFLYTTAGCGLLQEYKSHELWMRCVVVLQCLTLAEDWEQHLEDWWLKGRTDTPDLWQYVCVDTVKVCCQAGHFGSNCDPCPGFPDRICNNNGKCKVGFLFFIPRTHYLFSRYFVSVGKLIVCSE